jgi:SNF2 family DNA or RNA helicase/HJR/Mrr/RecB family endonuclease
MAELLFDHEILDQGAALYLREKRFFGRSKKPQPTNQWNLIAEGKTLIAVSHLFSWTDGEDVKAEDDRILVDHARIASLTGALAQTMGLPLALPHSLDIKSSGTIDEEDFRFQLKWIEPTGQVAIGIERKGAFISQGNRTYRLPDPIYSLLQKLEEFNASSRTDSTARLMAWAAIQDLLQIENVKGLKAEEYLLNTRIAHASSFSLTLKTEGGMFDFDPVLFGPLERVEVDALNENLEEENPAGGQRSEASQLLPPYQQRYFAENRFRDSPNVRDRYALRDGTYVVVDPSLQSALSVVRKAQASDADTRRNFARNPRAYLRDALGDEGDDELLENLFIETAEYSRRVVDIGIWEKRIVPWVQRSGDKWLPEKFGLKIGDETLFLEESEIPVLKENLRNAMAADVPVVDWRGQDIPATEQSVRALDALIDEIGPSERPDAPEDEALEKPEDEQEFGGPVVLVIDDNMDQVSQHKNVVPRHGGATSFVPAVIKSSLKAHQIEGLRWLQRAWSAGQKGALLADDMGLGKTLQCLSFFAWLQQGMQEGGLSKAPILVVAPTGLLVNWQQEHDLHLFEPGLGQCVRAYGSELRALRDTQDKEVDVGRSILKTGLLRDAAWVLTTYETLRDYQHSFGSVRFSVIAFDEIQKIKTPGTLMTEAAKAMNGDFMIGLTGTPIENRLADLWCIIDTLEPGYLGDLKTFSKTYEQDEDADRLKELKRLLTEQQNELEPVMLRRMKTDSLEGLPAKRNHVHSREMPGPQRSAYSEIIINAQKETGKGRMLKILHFMKSVSLHPIHPDQAEFPAYLSESARFESLFDILDDISTKQEKALIFVESLEMHPLLGAFIQRRYKLAQQPLIISGKVTGPKRQCRVNEFQASERGFDVMILSPRAGGVGLTLTAANHVIHLSRWWNPAVEDQCTDRVYRIGQCRTVHVYYLLALHPDFPDKSFDERIHALLERKRSLSQDMLLPPVNQANDTSTLFEETTDTAGEDFGFSESEQEPFSFQSATTLKDIDEMEPLGFESWCHHSLKNCGYNVSRTPRSWDCGADGIAVHPETNKSIIIQCKHTQSDAPLDATAIEDLIKARGAYELPDAELHAVTNAKSFSSDAKRLARQSNIILIDRIKLMQWPRNR